MENWPELIVNVVQPDDCKALTHKRVEPVAHNDVAREMLTIQAL